MYMYVKGIAFRILQTVYTACVWEWNNNKKKNRRTYSHSNTFTWI